MLLTIAFLSCFGSSLLFGQLNISHYSIALKGGRDYYLVTPSGNANGNKGWIFPGVSFEYTISYSFGIALNYDYVTYKRAEVSSGNTHDATLLFSYNIMNTLFPLRGGFWFDLNAYLNLGLGAGYYSATLLSIPNNAPIDSLGAAVNTQTLSGFSPLGTLAGNVEYNTSKSLAFFIEGQLRAYLKDDLGGLPSNTTFNIGFIAAAGIRYKFNAKDKTHQRNITSHFNCCR
jgi:hypothetical protein